MTEPSGTLLERVRKLLAQAEDESVTTAEAEAFTAKAAALMARYGIDRARLGALHPETDKQADRKIDVDNPWADVRAHLLAGLAQAMGCQCVLLARHSGQRLHVFGYESDLERVDVLYTSVLLQMASALQAEDVPPNTPARMRAYRRSFLLGYVSAVTARVKQAEEQAKGAAEREDAGREGPGTALVLADRSAQVKDALKAAYPETRKRRITYSGGGYGNGHAQGSRADIGGKSVSGGRKEIA
jgi:Protein of unknown function (DUF2786)